MRSMNDGERMELRAVLVRKGNEGGKAAHRGIFDLGRMRACALQERAQARTLCKSSFVNRHS